MLALYNHRACYGKVIDRIEGEGGREPCATVFFTDGTTLEITTNTALYGLTLSVPIKEDAATKSKR